MLKHIAVGMFVPYIIFVGYCLIKKGKIDSNLLARFPLILFFCAVWSLVPNVLSKLPVGILKPIFCNRIVSNIFFFHGLLRRVPSSGSTFGLGLIYIMFFSLIILFAHYLGRQEKEIAALQSGKNNII